MHGRRTRRALLAVALGATLLTGVPATTAGAQATETEVSGALPSGLTMWAPDGSPYVLTADVTVPADGLLYIAPGTTVTSEAGHQLVVNGRLQTSAMRFDLPGGIVVDSEADAEPGPNVLIEISRIQGATGTALEVLDGDVELLDTMVTTSGTAIESAADAGSITVDRSEIVGNSTVAVLATPITITRSHIAGFDRGILAPVATLTGNVISPPATPCTSDATGCALAVTSPTEASDIDGTYVGTSDTPAVPADEIWDDADDAALAAVAGTPAPAWFDTVLPATTIDTPAAQLPGTAAQLEGESADLPTIGQSGVLGTSVWIFNATDRTVWDDIDGTWVPFAPFEEDDLAFGVDGNTTWTADLPLLVPGNDYVAVAVATESGGIGRRAPSEPVHFSTFEAPGAPTITSTTVNGDRTVTVEWSPPDSDGGRPITSYELVCLPTPQPPLADLADEVRIATGTSAVIDPALAARYRCTVTGSTDAGTGPASTAVVVRVAAPAPTFDDVPAAAFFTIPVGWAQAIGLTTGVGGTNQFQPNRDITRAETITLLWRHAGSPGGYPAHGFEDASSTAFYSAALDWARAEGLTTGVGGTNDFQPDRTITRAETTTLLWRIAGSPTGDPAHGFDDASSTAFYSAALDWARAKGLTTGVAGTNDFQPDRTITRAESTTLLYRAATGS